MAHSHVELYEALKPTVGEDAARMMADVVPPAGNLVTREDLLLTERRLIEKLEGQISSLDERLSGQITDLNERLSGKITDLNERLSGKITSAEERQGGQLAALTDKVAANSVAIANLGARIDAASASQVRWMLGLFIPVWAATLGTLVAAVMKL